MSDEKEEVRCVRCHHVAEEKEEYCIKCGAPLINRCSDAPGLLSKGCGKKNHPGAAYCAHCGSPTVFHKEGLVPKFPSIEGLMSAGQIFPQHKVNSANQQQ